ncbi:MAG: NAD(P)/FAD-dependent oxidoreductase [Pseudomonadales bacterium]|nr:NAD(P)/FAD-dependent oxidoreductase [Pseudomonadales bacterium]
MNTDYDALIIGAGISGMYQLHRLRELGLRVHGFEAGSDVGGTWYWNRYPGARFDSESYSYGYSWSKALLDEWNWSEHFAAQPETLRYCQYVADRFDLRRDFTFNCRIRGARWHEDTRRWTVEREDGGSATATFLITAVGPLSAPTLPTIPGRETFRGEAYHTGLWPHHPVSFAGKRIAVIGTGATGVQTITEVAKTAGSLTVFQRTPNYCAPLGNRPITPEEQTRIKAGYEAIFAQCAQTTGAFLHGSDPRSALEVTPEEREAFFERQYNAPGFAIWMGNFSDIGTNPAANALASDFMRRKIRARINDPAIAEKLIPRDHGFGTRRVPLESGYYEVYNQDNVTLVDLNDEPIECIRETGIRTNRRTFEFDMIIYATGFDAVRGSFDRMRIEGAGGVLLKDAWADGPVTMLGLQTPGFPNLLTLVGPHNAAGFCNIPRCIEQNVDWVTDLLLLARKQGITRIEPTQEAAEAWTEHVYDMVDLTLFATTDSWFMGVNQNTPEKKRTFLAYAGGAPRYKRRCDDIAADGYRGFVLS